MINGYINVNKPCPICEQKSLVTANFSILCRSCECRFIWYKETDKDGNLLKSEIIADPREMMLFLASNYQSEDIMQRVKAKWITFYNNCYYRYRDKIKAFCFMKARFGYNCMLYESMQINNKEQEKEA